ncbi:uncharacterized protein LOC107627062 [Arachis ipaensis]|uniref:uncharacterized protein LOC107627062 n=1 Tax=Arachis ipaensis TaxID=130454 RepID=UPI0007AFB02D|nr:uncharacterized protein LOC107627062 [Arachis ipaensis]
MCFEALDRTLRDLMSVTDQHKIQQSFGGKVVVLGGDFRQILPVIPKGSRHDILSPAINSAHLWSFYYRYFHSSAILALMLESVEKVNDFILTIFPMIEKEYLSSDTCQADENEGLCNGIRLIVNELRNNVIGSDGSGCRNIGDKVYISRMNLIPLDSGLPFKFQRRQFPLAVCFAMTNKRVKVNNNYHM